MRLFSFCACSYDAHFHSTPSPITPIFIPRLLLRRLFSFPALSYCDPLQKPNTGTLPVKLVFHGIKDMRDERPTPPPQSFQGITPSPRPMPRPLHARTARWPLGGGGRTSTPFHSKHQFNAGSQKKRNYLLIRLFSFRIFSYNAYFHLASSATAHIFIKRILLWRIFSSSAFS